MLKSEEILNIKYLAIANAKKKGVEYYLASWSEVRELGFVLYRPYYLTRHIVVYSSIYIIIYGSARLLRSMAMPHVVCPSSPLAPAISYHTA
jgi:hypothetical protein